MAFSLKKWIGSMLFSTFMDEYNENMEAIEDKFGEVEGDIDLFEAHMADYATEIVKKANKQQEEWKPLPLQNGWTIVSGQYARYYKDEFNRVYVEGYITGGTDITFAILPLGYRPNANLTIPYVSSIGIFISVYTNGQLRFVGGTTGAVYFSFSFRASD